MSEDKRTKDELGADEYVERVRDNNKYNNILTKVENGFDLDFNEGLYLCKFSTHIERDLSAVKTFRQQKEVSKKTYVDIDGNRVETTPEWDAETDIFLNKCSAVESRIIELIQTNSKVWSISELADALNSEFDTVEFALETIKGDTGYEIPRPQVERRAPSYEYSVQWLTVQPAGIGG
jgi:hypothetical protein